ncbi:PREDICTED: centrosomal protein of 135 kDa-like [Priapulus caudatus]|uniref:Centrosomal protein of 135 kDa-like n=1 Tax=Priapulus caudatus TaxID=37621 RepID=A0ABM1EGI1_PRICU|nr:PREDICTED: centrosomal protein of 135 kDa-like [Priapulus caudatus]
MDKAEEELINLRRRLDKLGYRQPLSTESSLLVGRLFNDLVLTTESLRAAKLEATKNSTKTLGSSLNPYVEPYATENARLIKENNELQAKLANVQEAADAKSKGLKSSVVKLQHENADVRFLNSQYLHKICELEKDSTVKSDRLYALQEKNFQAVIQTPSHKQQYLPFRRQRMEIDFPLPPPDNVLKRMQMDDPYIADLLKVADTRIEELQTDVEKDKEDKANLEKLVDVLKKQVEKRDREVDRLNQLLKGGQPFDVVSAEAKSQGNEKLVQHLNLQLDFLQKENQELQQALKESKNQLKEPAGHLDDNRKEFENKLKDIGNLVHTLEHSSKGIQATDDELHRAKADRETALDQLRNSEQENATSKEEISRLHQELHNLRHTEVEQLKGLLDKSYHDKNALEVKVNELFAKDQELEMELGKLKAASVRSAAARSPGRVDKQMKQLEDEKDYYKLEADTMQKMMKNWKSTAPSSGKKLERPKSPTERLNSMKKGESIKNLTSTSKDTIDLDSTGGDTDSRRTPLPKGTGSGKKVPNTGTGWKKARARLLAGAKAEKKRDSEDFSGSDMTRSRRGRSRMDENSSEQIGLDSSNDFQTPDVGGAKNVSHYESYIKLLEEERDHYKQECEKLRSFQQDARFGKTSASDEIRKMRAENMKLRDTMNRFEKQIADVQASTRVLAAERDNLEMLHEQAKEELKSLRRDLLSKTPKTSAQASMAAQAMLRRLERERDEALSDVRRMTSERDTLREKLKVTTETHVNEKSFQDSRFEDQQNRLHSADLEKGELMSKYSAVKEMAYSLEGQVKSQTQQISQLKDEVNQHKGQANQMRQLAEQTERSLDDHQFRLSRRSVDLQSAEKTIQDLRASLGVCRSLFVMFFGVRSVLQLAEQTERSLDDHQFRLSRRSVDLQSAEKTIQDLRASLDGSERTVVELRGEVSTLRARVVTLDREKDSLQLDGDDKSERLEFVNQELKERETKIIECKDKIHEHKLNIEHLTEALSAKDREINSLKRQVDTTNQDVNDTSRARDIVNKENMRLNEDLEAMAKENQTINSDLQLVNEDREHLKLQVKEYIAEVARVHDLLAQKEQERYELLQQYRSLCETAQEIESQSEVLSSEASSARLEIAAKDINVKQLMERNTQVERNLQEGCSEVCKSANLNLDIDRLRPRISDFEDHVQKLRQQLYSERFEKERAVQELRRQGLNPPIPISVTSTSRLTDQYASTSGLADKSADRSRRTQSKSRESLDLYSSQETVSKRKPRTSSKVARYKEDSDIDPRRGSSMTSDSS